MVVDCIEFNERFRHADPIAEVAFLAMELTIEGRGDLAQLICRELMSRYWRPEGPHCCRSIGLIVRRFGERLRG